MGELKICIDSAELFRLTLVCSSCGVGIEIDMAREGVSVHNITQCVACEEPFPQSTKRALQKYWEYCGLLKASKSERNGADFRFSVAVDSK